MDCVLEKLVKEQEDHGGRGPLASCRDAVGVCCRQRPQILIHSLVHYSWKAIDQAASIKVGGKVQEQTRFFIDGVA